MPNGCSTRPCHRASARRGGFYEPKEVNRGTARFGRIGGMSQGQRILEAKGARPLHLGRHRHPEQRTTKGQRRLRLCRWHQRRAALRRAACRRHHPGRVRARSRHGDRGAATRRWCSTVPSEKPQGLRAPESEGDEQSDDYVCAVLVLLHEGMACATSSTKSDGILFMASEREVLEASARVGRPDLRERSGSKYADHVVGDDEPARRAGADLRHPHQRAAARCSARKLNTTIAPVNIMANLEMIRSSRSPASSAREHVS